MESNKSDALQNNDFDTSLIFGERLSQILKKRKIKQYQLAKTINVSTQIISNYVTGRSFPSQSTLKDICTALNVEKDWILGADVNPQLSQVKLISTHNLQQILDENILSVKDKLSKNYPFISDDYYNEVAFLLNQLFTLNKNGLNKVRHYIEDISLNDNNIVTEETDYKF